SPIVNLHYKIEKTAPPLMETPFIGLTRGLAQWLFVRDDIASVTISAADDVVDLPAEEIAGRVWRDVARALGTPNDPQPSCRVIKERRATFRQSPDQVALRPATRTRIPNLLLAGDWTDTGVPATIEGAIRSGFAAADAALAGSTRA
ncbi:MAG: FAD-dependent oxidoreductase, partial [Hyphomicrobiales bacterium]